MPKRLARRIAPLAREALAVYAAPRSPPGPPPRTRPLGPRARPCNATVLILRAADRHLSDVARLRVALLEETGSSLPAEERTALLASNEAFFRAHLASPAWATWVAEFHGRAGAVGTLAFWIRPPYPGNPDGMDAYLLNMYTSPEHRGRGAATAILGAALDEARCRGVRRLVLHATEAGRRLYVRAGFHASAAYMELALGEGRP